MCACTPMCMCSRVYVIGLGRKEGGEIGLTGQEEKLSGTLEEREIRGWNRRELRTESEYKRGGTTLIP